MPRRCCTRGSYLIERKKYRKNSYYPETRSRYKNLQDYDRMKLFTDDYLDYMGKKWKIEEPMNIVCRNYKIDIDSEHIDEYYY